MFHFPLSVCVCLFYIFDAYFVCLQVKFMLDAKKMGHSIYSFARKQELFSKIHKMCNIHELDTDGNVLIEKKLKRMIITKNLSKFSSYFENINKFELEYVKSNKQTFESLINENGWRKGLTVFQTYVK